MSMIPTAATGRGAYPGFFPPKGAAPTEILEFRNRQVTPWNVRRVETLRRVSIAINYAMGNQDIELDKGSLVSGTRGYSFKARSPSGGLPNSDNNKISAPVEVEVASILKRQWIPKIPASSPDPRVAAAAQVSEGVLLFNMEAGGWPSVRYDNAFNFVVMGTSILTSYLDLVYTELHQVGAPTAVYCLQCKSPYHSQEIPPEAAQLLQQGSERLQPGPARPGMQETESPYLRMGGCPECGGEFSQNLEGFEPEPGMVDFLGRPLLVDAPVGRPRFEADTPYEWHPENQGLRVSPHTMRRWFRRKVRSLDWLEEHQPDAITTFGIMPESPQKLIHENPHIGTWRNLGGYSGNFDAGLLDHHVNVDEGVELPTVRSPKGRYIMAVQNQLLVDEDLLIEGEIGGEKVYAPRIQVSVARYRLRPGELWGSGLPDGVISKQNRYNTIMRQIAFTRGTMGAPMVMAPDGMEIRGPEMLKGYGSRLFRFVPDPSVDPKSPLAAPTIWPGAAFPTESYRELEILDRDIKEEVGPQEIDYGAAPKNITTTSGLQILGENSQTRRNPREVEYNTTLERMWSHILDLEKVHRTEEAEYEVAGPNNTWAVKQYDNLSLCGLTKVKAEKQAFAEKSIVMREAMREAKADMLLDVTSPVIRRKMLEGYGLSSDLNEDSNLQMDRAEQLWVDFIDQGQVPVIDETLDNHAIRWMVYGIRLQMNEGTDLMRVCRWPETLRAIAGWENDVLGMLDAEQAMLGTYGTLFTSEEQAAPAYAQAKLAYDDQVEAFDKESQEGAAAVKTGLEAPPPMTEAPIPPPEPIIQPIMMQDKILQVWQGKLAASGNQELLQFLRAQNPIPLGEKQVVPGTWLAFRAVVEAHRMIMQKPAPLPPGSGATGIPGDKGSPTGPAGGSAPPQEGMQQPPEPQVASKSDGGRVTGRLS